MAHEHAWCFVFHKWCFRCRYNLRMSEIFYPHRGVNASKEQAKTVLDMLWRTCAQRSLQWSFLSRKLDRERPKTVKIARRPKKKGAEKARTPACCWCSRFLRPFGFWNTPAPPSQAKKLQRKTVWSAECNTFVPIRQNFLLLFLVTGARGFGKMQMILINFCVTCPPKK